MSRQTAGSKGIAVRGARIVIYLSEVDSSAREPMLAYVRGLEFNTVCLLAGVYW
jgi:hypothetical protein